MAEKKKPTQHVVALDPVALKELRKQEEDFKAVESGKEVAGAGGTLELILKSLKSAETNRAERLSFDVDPKANYSAFAALYRTKTNLTPDHIIKRIIGPQGDDLVCQILQARSNMVASFGRPRTSRFALGFQFEEMKNSQIQDGKKAHDELQEKLDKLKEVFWNCGLGPIDEETIPLNMSQFNKMITRDALAYGRVAIERIFRTNPKTLKEELYAWRPVDAGTIYRILPQKENDQSTRKEALRLLAELKNEKFDASRYEKDEYKWVQVIESRPVQAFTDKELIVYNIYPTTNVEYNGYPLTPIDQALNAITTHINIAMHNRLYFQNGRASHGMLVFTSDTVDEQTLHKIKVQFNASINSTQNAYRMPVFGVGKDEQLNWQPIDTSGRDAEFQYLMDNNSRVILSAFQMSPEELPGYAHLARGTNTQALSESDNEWKLTAARDVGLRPLLYDIQDIFNTHILPYVSKEIADSHQLTFAGLEHDSPEKESTRLQQDAPIHMTYNEIMERVEKDPILRELGGDFPLNPQFKQQVIDPYLSTGEILENFFGKKGAASDPRFSYYRDQFWLSYQQILMQKAQMAMQQQMMQMQQMQQQLNPPEQSESPPNDEQAPPNASDEEKEKIQKSNLEKREKWAAQNYMILEKTTQNNHDMISKHILQRHKEIVNRQMEQFKADSKKALANMADALHLNDEDHDHDHDEE